MMRTVAAPSSLEMTIKRSRFIAHVARIDSQADTLAFYDSVADPAATHNCWAWKLGQQYRFNDDGEPSGTAGRPMLGAIEGKQADHVMVVVTRWFGGIKLGVGGLLRAYGGSAAKCLDHAGLFEVREQREYVIDAAFEWTGQVHAALQACDAEKLEETFQEAGLKIRLSVDATRSQKLKALLRDTTRGEVGLRSS